MGGDSLMQGKINTVVYDQVTDNQCKPTEGTVLEGEKGIMEVQDLNAWYGNTLAIKHISMSIKSKTITAIIGPSGCGKSTFIRCLNRMHEVSHGGRVQGCILLDGKDIYARDVDHVVAGLRNKVEPDPDKPVSLTLYYFQNKKKYFVIRYGLPG